MAESERIELLRLITVALFSRQCIPMDATFRKIMADRASPDLARPEGQRFSKPLVLPIHASIRW